MHAVPQGRGCHPAHAQLGSAPRSHAPTTPFCCPLAFTSACPPGVRVLLQRSHFKQNLCQSLPREETFSAVEK